MAMPKLIATIEIRIIGLENELLPLPLIILREKKSSKFKFWLGIGTKQK